MKISYNWLKDYINIEIPASELAKYLTEIGLEVGKVEHFQSIKGGLEGLYIGQVLTCKKHTNADKLSVTTVDIGNGKVLPIVCGAPNVAEGQKVVVATVGTILYKGDEQFEIKKAKIRGEESEGMICAEDEIGIGESHAGIIVLPDDVKVGMLAKEYFDVYEDWVIEVDITPNRQDAFSHFGVARDLFAYFLVNSEQKIKLSLPNVDQYKQDRNNINIDVEIKNSDACPRYSGVTMSGIKVGETPKWMQNRLKAIGLKPINNIVDITNYVLFEIGHPLHAFDANKIDGNKIIVDTVQQGTEFICLDGKKLSLTEQDLMICNSNHTPMCMGGIMGGIESGINEKTSNIFIESAFFNPVWVRKSAKRHQINSDSSFRFERGVDINSGIWALKRAAMLIKQYAGGSVSSEIKDIYNQPIDFYEIELSCKQLRKIAGFEISTEKVEKILNALEIKIIYKSETTFKLQVPTYRFDVRTQADVIEDILRIYGYNNVPMNEMFAPVTFYQQTTEIEKYRQKVSSFLISNGFYETMSFSCVSSDLFEKFDFISQSNAVILQNPLSKNLDTMRQSLVFGALDSVARNVNNQNPNIKFFEFGSTYFKKHNNQSFNGKYIQNYLISLTLTGLKQPNNWLVESKNNDFYTLKTYSESILKLLGIDLKSIKIEPISNSMYKYGLNYIIDNKQVMIIGCLSKNLIKYYDIEQEVYYGEIDWQLLNEKSNTKKFYKEIVKYPFVKRDLSMLLENSVIYSTIENVGYNTDKRIKDIVIFDVYEGKNLPENKKSYALSYYIQDDTKTLADTDIDSIMSKLIKNYQKIGIEIRM